MVGLGFLPGGNTSLANGVSADGSLVVGYAEDSTGAYQAFRWTNDGGMQSIRDMLIARGLDLSGWDLRQAQAVSADGSTIVGWGFFGGQTQAWRVQGLGVPEPHFGLLAIGSALLVSSFRRKRRT
jgi:probable HAF family extracellular repeat protein